MNNFEKNINRIEEIANKVENNDLQIEEMSKLYQEGMNPILNSEKELMKNMTPEEICFGQFRIVVADPHISHHGCLEAHDQKCRQKTI